ncbi:MAG: DIP1984 family protein [Caldilineales bacterium]
MKLAEALILRADYQKRMAQLQDRLLRNAQVQEGEAPAENPASLLRELEKVADDLTRLIQRINATNAASELEADMTLSDALAVRDVLKSKHGAYSDLAQAATVSQDRYSKSEVKFLSAVNVSEVQARADDIARQLRELDMRIQEANWRIVLQE